MSDHEQQLLETAKNGGVEAFEELTGPHQARVYNFLLSECGNEFEAGQLTQEVFVRTFDLLTKKADIGNLYACIYRTASEISRQAAHESKKIS
ncbi:MAG: hypothetical protein GX279_06210 [Clostridiaceae bacterium]|nr:hypothetical protein [Clostridiaceae bacterium]